MCTMSGMRESCARRAFIRWTALVCPSHDARLTLGTYGHVIEELDGAPQADAGAAIQAARSGQAAHQLPKAASE